MYCIITLCRELDIWLGTLSKVTKLLYIFPIRIGVERKCWNSCKYVKMEAQKLKVGQREEGKQDLIKQYNGRCKNKIHILQKSTE